MKRSTRRRRPISERFEQAAANMGRRPGTRTKREQLELDAVQAQAYDLRCEIVAFLGLASSATASKG